MNQWGNLLAGFTTVQSKSFVLTSCDYLLPSVVKTDASDMPRAWIRWALDVATRCRWWRRLNSAFKYFCCFHFALKKSQKVGCHCCIPSLTINWLDRAIVAWGGPLLPLCWGAILTVSKKRCVADFQFFLFQTTMSDVDESAKLWKVNRTIHELVKDRVSISEIIDRSVLASHYVKFDLGFPSFRWRNQHGPRHLPIAVRQ